MLQRMWYKDDKRRAMRYIITTLLLLAFATSSHADRAWVLWSHLTFMDQVMWETVTKSNTPFVDILYRTLFFY